VKLLWFLSGLAIGLTIWVWYQGRVKQKLKVILQDLQVVPAPSAFRSISRLATLVHQQRQTNHQLEHQLQTWQQILQAAPLSYLQVDEQNQLAWSNFQAGQLLGIDPGKQSQRRLLLELVRSYELDRLIGEVRTVQKPCQKDWIFHPSSTDALKVPQQYPLRGHAFPLGGGDVGIYIENRQEAVTLTQERDRWASDVAHELKTPLTSIRLVAETLQVRLDSPLRIWVDRLLNETIRLSTLVQDLLDLGRIALKLPKDLALKTLDLPSLIQSAWLNLEPLANKKRLRLDYGGPERLAIAADETRLYRALLNLFDNSIKYSPPAGVISLQVTLAPSLGTAEVQQTVEIDIIDQGPGFPEQALPHVFERFYRADPARSREVVDPPATVIDEQRSSLSWQQLNMAAHAANTDTPLTAHPSTGSGLGLAIVQQIIEAHGGSVQASNHPQTHGAWLHILLPLQPFKKTDDYTIGSDRS